MSVTMTTPTNNSEFLWKTPVTFKGKAEGEIVKIELFAEQYHLGSDDVQSGEWIVNYPGFNKPGLRKIRVVGFDKDGNKVDSTTIQRSQ